MLQKCYEYDPFNVSRTKQPLCNFQNSTGCKDPSQTKLASIGALTEQQQAQRSSQFPMNSCHLWAHPSEHGKDDPCAKGETRNCIGQDETVDPELRWRFTVWGLSHSFAQASNPQIAFGMVEASPLEKWQYCRIHLHQYAIESFCLLPGRKPLV